MTRSLKFGLLLLLTGSGSSLLFACTCVAPPPEVLTYRALAEWHSKFREVVFQGRVEQVELKGWPPRPVPGETWSIEPVLLVTFSDVKMYRGDSQSRIEVETGLGGGDCGYPFVKGRSYLVSASKDGDGGRLSTGICSGTLHLDEADAELRFIKGEPASAEDLKNWRSDQESSPTKPDVSKVSGRLALPRGEHFEGNVIFWSTETLSVGAGDEAEPSADGSFCGRNLDPGTYIAVAIETEAKRNGFRYLSYYPGTTLKSEAKAIVVDRSTRIADLNFPLLRQHLLVVDGKIVGEKQHDMKVALMPSDFVLDQMIEPVIVESNGTFHLDNVPPGHYVLFAYVENGSDDSLTFESKGLELDVTHNIDHLSLEIVTKR